VIISSFRTGGIERSLQHAIDLATSSFSHALVANSQAWKRHYFRRGGLAQRVIVIGNGVRPLRRVTEERIAEFKAVHRLGRFSSLIGMVAALEPRKNQRALILAMDLVRRTRPGTGLILAGDGSRRAALEELSEGLGIRRDVVFLGTLDLPELLYPLLDVYVQLSNPLEGTSNSILEAMEFALPVVASDGGGNRDVVADGHTGRLVRTDDPRGLAEAVLSLLDNPSRRSEWGLAGQHRVRTRFTLQAMVDETERLYGSMLAAATAPALRAS
jgi:glycosyltransferase involved in cell wall biosynthesis